jgi:hypothetical protein
MTNMMKSPERAIGCIGKGTLEWGKEWNDYKTFYYTLVLPLDYLKIMEIIGFADSLIKIKGVSEFIRSNFIGARVSMALKKYPEKPELIFAVRAEFAWSGDGSFGNTGVVRNKVVEIGYEIEEKYFPECSVLRK